MKAATPVGSGRIGDTTTAPVGFGILEVLTWGRPKCDSTRMVGKHAPRRRRHCLCASTVGADGGVTRRRCPRCRFMARTFGDVIERHREHDDTYGVPPDTPKVIDRRHDGIVGSPSADAALYGVTEADVARARSLAAQPKDSWEAFNQRKERERRHGYAPTSPRPTATHPARGRRPTPLTPSRRLHSSPQSGFSASQGVRGRGSDVQRSHSRLAQPAAPFSK